MCLLTGSGCVIAADTIVDAAAAGERNLAELARALDAASADSTGEIADVARMLALVSSRDAVRDALRNLLPELSRHHALKQQRTHRQPARATANSRGAPVLLASLTTLEIEYSEQSGAGNQRPKTGLWLQAWADRAKQDSRDDIRGFESDVQGVAIGFDRSLTENFTAGVSLTRQTGNVDSQRFGADNLETHEVSVYSSLSLGRNVLSATLRYADNDTDRQRVVVVNTDSGSRTFSLAANVGSKQTGGSLSWTGVYGSNLAITVAPFASLSFARLDTDEYLESGGGTLSLLVETDSEEEIIGSTGLSLGTTRFVGNWLLAPNLTAGFEHDFKSDATQTLSRFRGTPYTFESRGYSIEDNRWRLSIGLQLLHIDGFGIGVALETHRKDDYRYDAAIISLQTQF